MYKAIRKLDFLYCETGYGNGYVAVPPTHPMYWKDYKDVDVEIHWGLTYAEPATKKILEEVPEFSHIPEGYWIFGFDCAHAWDNEINCSKEFVETETQNLFDQLNKLS